MVVAQGSHGIKMTHGCQIFLACVVIGRGVKQMKTIGKAARVQISHMLHPFILFRIARIIIPALIIIGFLEFFEIFIGKTL